MHYLRLTIGENNNRQLEPAITLIESSIPIPDHYVDEEPDSFSLITDPNKNHVPVVIRNYIQTKPLNYTKYFRSTDQNKVLTKLLINRIKTSCSIDGERHIGFIGELVLEDISTAV